MSAEPLACPRCHGGIRVDADGARCDPCDVRWPGDAGWLDLYDGEAPELRGVGPRAMHFGPLARIYEAVWRPSFVAVASAGRPRIDEELEAIQGHLAPARGGAVLDLSCGPGVIGRRLWRCGAYREVYGLDLSRPMLEQCLAHCRAEGVDGLRLVRGDVGNLPFADGSLAGVHAGAALHLWPSPPDALAEVQRALRPGGVLVATTFVRARRPPVLRLAHRAFERLTTTRFFERGELDRLAADAGLVDFEARYRGAFILFACRRPAGSTSG